MRRSPRNPLSAALTLGAALLAWPAQAFQCEPSHPFPQPGTPINVVVEDMIKHARTRVEEAQVLFTGILRSAEYLSSDHFGATYIITFDVVEWKKGKGRPYAKFLYGQWCSQCSEEEKKTNAAGLLKEFSGQRIYTIKRGPPIRPEKGVNVDDLDGATSLCEILGSVAPLSLQGPRDIGSPYQLEDVLYDFILEEETKKVPISIR